MTLDNAHCCARKLADDLASTAAVNARATRETAAATAAIPRRWSSAIGGSFWMGSNNGRFPGDGEGPVRQIMVSQFEIACHVVSNLQFGDFVRATGYTTEAELCGWSFVFAGLLSEQIKSQIGSRSAQTPWWIPLPRAYWAQPEGPHSTILQRLDHPVVHISWNDAQAYCKWSSTRLPTEAEWEIAARGGLERATYPWGDELTPAGQHHCNIWQGTFPEHNTANDGYFGTAPVHAFGPNGYGLYNTAGNVWEWCVDYFSPKYHLITSSADPFQEQPTGNRALRGGSFLCHESYCNRYRVAARGSNTPESAASNIGFRVVNSGNI